jgi:hypothetical protein
MPEPGFFLGQCAETLDVTVPKASHEETVKKIFSLQKVLELFTKTGDS